MEWREFAVKGLGAYDHIISLGEDCRVAQSLRSTFAIKAAYPFDWWLSSLPGLVAFLKDPSLDRLYDPALLEPHMEPGGIGFICNRHYGVQLHHEFPRGEDRLVVPDWADHIGRARERTQYLWDRMFGFLGRGTVLFVRWSSTEERQTLAGRYRGLVEEACRALESIFGASTFQLLLINPAEPVDAPGVFSMTIADPNESRWDGSRGLWARRLIEEGLEFTGKRRTPRAASNAA